MVVLRKLCFGLLVLALPAAAAAHDHDALMEEVRALGDVLTEALLAEDVDAMLAMYADDAISLPNYSHRMDGIEAFKQHHKEMADSGIKIRSFTSDPTDVWECGDQVIEVGTFEISMSVPGMPGEVEDRGKYVTVYVRGEDGSLKIKVETWNTDMNPMEMAVPPGHAQGE